LLLQHRQQMCQELVELEGPARFDCRLAIEPSQFRFAFGIDVVVDFHQALAKVAALVQKVAERREALSGFRGHPDDRPARELLVQQPREFFDFGARQFIDPVEDHEVGFFDLLAKDVFRLG